MTLNELIAKAREEKKWLRCSYQDLWFSPSELERSNAEGKFLWGAGNFELLDPEEKINRLTLAKSGIEQEINNVRTRIKTP